MKKSVKIALVTILAVYAVFITLVLFVAAKNQIVLETENAELLAKYNELKESSDALAESWEAIQPEYQQYLDEKAQGVLDSVDTLLFEGWADLISEKNFVCAVDNETLLTIVYSEGQTMNEMLEIIKEHITTFDFMLESSEFTTGIITVMNDNNEVWFGYTVENGEAVVFVSEDYVN